MTHETTTSLGPAEVIAAAKRFFGERVPNNAAFPEKEGPTWLTLRGQGGEEIALALRTGEAGSHIRASTLFFDQAVERFLSTLPQPAAATR